MQNMYFTLFSNGKKKKTIKKPIYIFSVEYSFSWIAHRDKPHILLIVIKEETELWISNPVFHKSNTVLKLSLKLAANISAKMTEMNGKPIWHSI